MKSVNIKNFQFSKIIMGTNPFYGRSHLNLERDDQYKKYFDDSKIEEMIELGILSGINCIETSANERILKIIINLRKKSGKEINLLGTTRIDETSNMKNHHEKLSFLIKNKASICFVHSQFVERPRTGNTIRGLDKMIDEIHGNGLLTGVSVHKVETVEFCEKNNYDIDVYMFPFNITGFVYPGYDGKETAKERAELVRNINKPFIIMKALGAGRIKPTEALPFIAENIKPSDCITIGFGNSSEFKDTIDICEKLF